MTTTNEERPDDFAESGQEAIDWRERILNDLPSETVQITAYTYPEALELIRIASYNRRISLGDFIGRAALAFAVYDSAGEHTWEAVTDKEPPLADRTRRRLPKRRMRGRGFGPWKIGNLS